MQAETTKMQNKANIYFKPRRFYLQICTLRMLVNISVKGHIYGETHVNHIYQNYKQAAKKEITVTDSVSALLIELGLNVVILLKSISS